MLDETGCDAIMIGRGVLGNPWLIKECVSYIEENNSISAVTPLEKLQMILKHLDYLISTKNDRVALLEMRTHIAYYLKGVPNSTELKQQVFKTNSIEELKNLIKEFIREKKYEN